MEKNRFKGRLMKMIKDVNGRFDDYFILPKLRQILLHQDYEPVENYLLFYFFVQIKMSYYLFNRQKLFQRTKNMYRNYKGKEEAAKYDIENKKF